MLLGPAMLMKSMGIDPEEITKNIKQFGDAMLEMQQGIARIEAKVDTLIKEQENDKKENTTRQGP